MPERVRVASEESLVRAARDERLIDAFRSGRADAFDELVRAYTSTVHRLLAQLNATASDIEDLTQDVFLRVFRNLHHFRGQASFYTWLYRITVNVFFDHSKKRKRSDLRLARIEAKHRRREQPGLRPARPVPRDRRAARARITRPRHRRPAGSVPWRHGDARGRRPLV